VAVPAVTAVTLPVLLPMVAIAVLDDVQVVVLVTSECVELL
jgi:hypothetical protein